MEIVEHNIQNKNIAEIISDEIIINTAEDALDLLGNMYYQGYEVILIYEKNLCSDFFDLKSGLAGEILQKFSNYRMRLFVIGDFQKFTSTSLKDFIYESNKGKQVNFVAQLSDALQALSNTK